MEFTGAPQSSSGHSKSSWLGILRQWLSLERLHASDEPQPLPNTRVELTRLLEQTQTFVLQMRETQGTILGLVVTSEQGVTAYDHWRTAHRETEELAEKFEELHEKLRRMLDAVEAGDNELFPEVEVKFAELQSLHAREKQQATNLSLVSEQTKEQLKVIKSALVEVVNVFSPVIFLRQLFRIAPRNAERHLPKAVRLGWKERFRRTMRLARDSRGWGRTGSGDTYEEQIADLRVGHQLAIGFASLVGEIYEPYVELESAIIAKLASLEQPRTELRIEDGFTPFELRQRLDVSDDTLANYAKEAGVATPGRGQREHRYSQDDAIRICETILKSSAARRTRLSAKSLLDELVRAQDR